MKLLLSCVNTRVSLIGFDTDTQQPFWYLPSNILRACGICYLNNNLLIAADDHIIRVGCEGVSYIKLPGPHGNFAHSIRRFGDMIAIADTGNSRVLITDQELAHFVTFDPIEAWGDRPVDAIHINDMLVLDDEILASCFNYQPFRHFADPKFDWRPMKLGLILSMRKFYGKTVTRVVASGLDFPHSLSIEDDKLYCCSAFTGELIEFSRNARGTFNFSKSWKVTDKKFLRGALRRDGIWFLGGSSGRGEGEEKSPMSLLRLDMSTGEVLEMWVAAVGEIYDVLPWHDEIVRPLVDVMNNLPVQDLDCGDYPAVIDLP